MFVQNVNYRQNIYKRPAVSAPKAPGVSFQATDPYSYFLRKACVKDLKDLTGDAGAFNNYFEPFFKYMRTHLNKIATAKEFKETSAIFEDNWGVHSISHDEKLRRVVYHYQSHPVYGESEIKSFEFFMRDDGKIGKYELQAKINDNANPPNKIVPTELVLLPNKSKFQPVTSESFEIGGEARRI